MKKDNDLVSIIIPSFNAEEHIGDAIQSVIDQTYKHIEIIVVDDGSHDRTREIAASFGGSVRVLHQENQGAAAARNCGASHATGSWLAFLDADDIWLEQKLERQLLGIGANKWSYTDARFLGGVNDGQRDSQFTRKPEGNVLRDLVQGNFIGTSTVLMKKQVFEESGGFDSSLQSIEDWELWARIAARHSIAYLDEPCSLYRVHATSTSRNTRRTLPNHLEVIDTIFSRVAYIPNLARLKPYAKATSCSICSYIAEEEGDARFALSCAVRACKYDPFNRIRWIRLAKSWVKFLLSYLPNFK